MDIYMYRLIINGKINSFLKISPSFIYCKMMIFMKTITKMFKFSSTRIISTNLLSISIN